jgi:hypothetical protein
MRATRLSREDPDEPNTEKLLKLAADIRKAKRGMLVAAAGGTNGPLNLLQRLANQALNLPRYNTE